MTRRQWLIATYVVGTLIFLWAFLAHPPTGSQDWASWVQAVGSIGAILATLGVVNRQHSLEAERYVALQKAQYIADLRPIAELVGAATLHMKLADDVVSGVASNSQFDNQEAAKHADHLVGMLIDLHPSELPKLRLRLAFMELRDSFRTMLNEMQSTRTARMLYPNTTGSEQQQRAIRELKNRALGVQEMFFKEVGLDPSKPVEI